ncbi:MAG: NADH-ubiquinone oxidoreductase-F iron-sulfur binding region domain-containing protein, partial [Solirubrobacteraceae bacterium]
GQVASLAGHLDGHGTLPSPRSLAQRPWLDAIDRSGLRGRGGGAFPTALKMRAVAGARGRAIVVANGCESEPLSAKDALLLRELPHLVLDGAHLAARAVGADEVILAHEHANPLARASLEHALAERRAACLDDVRFELFEAADRFLTGQETALVSQLNGGPAAPTFIPPRPTHRGVRLRPTLIQNVETLAHLALIARHGPDWFRACGTATEPGSTLITLLGAVGGPGVYEIERGTALSALLEAAGGVTGGTHGLLVGGYFGSWLRSDLLDHVELSNEGLAEHGASLGCGIVVALPADACPVAETVRVASYLAAETAHQCGPCVYGTAAIARTLHGIAEGRPSRGAFDDLARWNAELPGRGACHLPNGLVSFVAGALRVFATEFDDHARHGPCDACVAEPALAVPIAGAGT